MKRLIALFAAFLFALPVGASDFEYYIIKTWGEWQAGAAVVIVEKGEVRLLKGYGQKTPSDIIRPHDFVTEDTVFQAGSIAKGLAAELARALEREGLIRLDTPVSLYIPEYDFNGLTVSDILNQQNPLYPYTGGALGFFGFRRDEMLTALSNLLAGRNDKGFSYQNITFCAFEEIVERVTNLPYEKAMERYVLAPLGMASTGFGAGHFEGSDHILGSFLEGKSPRQIADTGITNTVYAFNAAAGLNTTARDMGIWLKYLIENYDGPMEDGYHMGWFIKDKIIYNVGTAFGSECALAFSPSEGRGIAVLFAVTPSPAYRLAMDYFSGDIKDEPALPPDEGESSYEIPYEPPLPRYEYAGVYENPIYKRAKIAEAEGRLTLNINETALSLTHVTGDYFSADLPKGLTRLLSGIEGISFRRGSDGNVVGFDLAAATLEGAGTFTRASE